MSYTRRLVPAVLLASVAALVACDDDVTGVQIADFQGTWTATTIQYTAHADASRNLNIVPLGGGLTLTIDAAGNYSGTFTFPGEPPIPITGSVTLVSDTEADIVFNWPPAVTQPPITDFRAQFNLQGNNLTFTRQSAVFQFPGQPQPETVSLVIIMTRS
jgi:hypothetical protein